VKFIYFSISSHQLKIEFLDWSNPASISLNRHELDLKAPVLKIEYHVIGEYKQTRNLSYVDFIT
jgi:hypothetical protein